LRNFLIECFRRTVPRPPKSAIVSHVEVNKNDQGDIVCQEYQNLYLHSIYTLCQLSFKLTYLMKDTTTM